ncbi:hypothetical protein RA263_08945 [Pseudomonas syringae pv. tagetis]|nr:MULTISPECIES: hypothetical protein [Pseudomonas syringae group]KPY84370.1 Uncharacterized protein ALO44_00022 [Pseudomonas syringae pv. tagetis]RMR09891.1 hypothetical protein ALP93_02076 [Pseudomonas syringae pv. helianthi]RMV50469.1 hypothetical protein ALP10_03094 [Pseudomonas syringae pv. helianthi]RMW14116.1 hypothetical protein ALO98_01760 [Pseudomonas syringae pv. tagetis]RMW17128.1 hypothetical protein ALO97_00226 [Pseudomonas syringae pv. tagetis]
MNTKHARTRSSTPTASELITAVETFVAKGGVIAVIPDGKTAGASQPLSTDTVPATDPRLEYAGKVEQLKYLAAKGAGFTALQYSLRMNKKDVRQLATENGVRVNFSQPVLTTKREARHDSTDVDDVVAGHAMHYSALGYTVAEIAQVLDLSISQVWNIGKAYRFEFRQHREDTR